MEEQKFEAFKDFFKDLKSATPETFHQFLTEMTGTLASLQSRISSTDKEERQEAVKEANQWRELFENQLFHMSEKLGIDLSDLQQKVLEEEQNPEFKQIKEQMDEMKERFSAPKKSSKKSKKLHFIG